MVAYTQWGSDGPVSRRLLLLRHAAAEFSGGQDHNRPLSTTGRAQARAQGVHMLAASLVPQSVICSSALRTRTTRSEEHTSELQSRGHLVCRLLLEKKTS